MNFFSPFSGAFGLDISDRGIKVVQLVRRSSFKKHWRQIKFKAAWILPPGLIVNGELKKPELVMNNLKTSLFGHGQPHPKTHWAVASLPETKSFLKVVTLKIPAEKLTTEVVNEAAAAYLPFSLDEIYLDWRLLSEDKKNGASEVLLAAVEQKIADSYTYLLNIAGLTPLALETEALSLARCLISTTNPPKNKAVGLLDLGATKSLFALYDRQTVQFSLNLPFSAAKLDQKIATAYQITLPETERMRIDFSRLAPAAQATVKKIVEAELAELTDKILAAVRFYQERFSHASPLTKILLSGGLANLPGLESALSQKLNIHCRLADLTVNLGDRPPLPHLVDSTLATALGLALRALDNQFV